MSISSRPLVMNIGVLVLEEIQMSGTNDEEEDVTPEGVNLEMLKEDVEVEYDDWDGIGALDMLVHKDP